MLRLIVPCKDPAKSSNSLLEECVSTATVQLYQTGSAFGGGGEPEGERVRFGGGVGER